MYSGLLGWRRTTSSLVSIDFLCHPCKHLSLEAYFASIFLVVTVDIERTSLLEVVVLPFVDCDLAATSR